MSIKNTHLSRRDFLKHTALGVAGAGIGINGFRNLQVAFGADESLPFFDKSMVIAVKRSGIMKDGKPDPKIIQHMMNEGMYTLTGKKTTAEAWRTFFTPKMLLGLRSTQSAE